MATLHNTNDLLAHLGELGVSEAFSAEQAPAGCPWHPAGDAAAQVRQMLSATDAPSFVQAMAERVRAVAFGRVNEVWMAFYGLEDLVVSGGPPDAAPAVREEHAELAWQVPAPLQAFYAVHGGMGPFYRSDSFWYEDSVLPAAALFPMSHYIRFGEENLLYDPGDLLQFSPDGMGNGQCFRRPQGDTVRWDCISRELGPSESFAAYLTGLVERW